MCPHPDFHACAFFGLCFGYGVTFLCSLEWSLFLIKLMTATTLIRCVCISAQSSLMFWHIRMWRIALSWRLTFDSWQKLLLEFIRIEMYFPFVSECDSTEINQPNIHGLVWLRCYKIRRSNFKKLLDIFPFLAKVREDVNLCYACALCITSSKAKVEISLPVPLKGHIITYLYIILHITVTYSLDLASLLDLEVKNPILRVFMWLKVVRWQWWIFFNQCFLWLPLIALILEDYFF